jgi:hypothetical protein
MTRPMLFGILLGTAAGCKEVEPTSPWTRLEVVESALCALNAGADAWCWGDTDPLGTSGRSGPFETVTLSGVHACALTVGQQPECWGVVGVAGFAEEQRTALLHPPVGDYVAIDGGGTAICMLDGSSEEITCVGGSITDVPDGAFASFDVGREGACALDVFGLVTCWGWDFFDVETPDRPLLDVSVGSEIACGVDEEGGALCWPDPAEPWDLTALSDGRVVLEIDVDDDICVLLDDGRARCILDGDLTELGDEFTEVEAGAHFGCGLRHGEVVCSENAPTPPS